MCCHRGDVGGAGCGGGVGCGVRGGVGGGVGCGCGVGGGGGGHHCVSDISALSSSGKHLTTTISHFRGNPSPGFALHKFTSGHKRGPNFKSFQSTRKNAKIKAREAT